jgi:hypothetical protein
MKKPLEMLAKNRLAPRKTVRKLTRGERRGSFFTYRTFDSLEEFSYDILSTEKEVSMSLSLKKGLVLFGNIMLFLFLWVTSTLGGTILFLLLAGIATPLLIAFEVPYDTEDLAFACLIVCGVASVLWAGKLALFRNVETPRLDAFGNAVTVRIFWVLKTALIFLVLTFFIGAVFMFIDADSFEGNLRRAKWWLVLALIASGIYAMAGVAGEITKRKDTSKQIDE